MNELKVESFMAGYAKFFPAERLGMIRERVTAMPDERIGSIQVTDYKDPVVALVLSLFLGGFGVDRFYIGHVGLGLGKLFTCGGCGIWTFIDWFLIMQATKEENMRKFVYVAS